MEEIPIRRDGLQIEEDRRFQERFWTVERIAWCAFGLVLLAALAGLTGGGGPLSDGSRAVGSARVDYPKVARWTAPDTIEFRFGEDGTARILLAPDFLAAFEIEGIEPEPAVSSIGAAGLRLEIETDAKPTAPVILRIQPRFAGLARYAIGVGGSEPVTFSTVVMP